MRHYQVTFLGGCLYEFLDWYYVISHTSTHNKKNKVTLINSNV